MTELPLFYYPELLRANDTLSLPEDEARHVVQVLRMKPGELLQLVDGIGHSAQCAISDTGKKTCTVRVSTMDFQEQPQPRLQLCIAFTKNTARNEWLLEKATELGVSSIQPIICNRSNRERNKEERWQKILVSAMLQSQQTWLPELCPTQSLEAVLNTSFSQKLLAHCLSSDTSRQPISIALKKGLDTQLFIGPEGDFSEHELQLAKTAGATTISLGSNRLRTETAALAAISQFYLFNHAH
ncbi:MAG: 16S rRNA (uracil(1498)-N(3))-methyltransferase [Bacteroidetes bacterium]|nr:16S rRNA (uracil(1498)-N(3))-methyltransferase [Bacteroidota bacterium]